MESLSKEFHEKLKNLTSDPFVKLLLSESHLTEKQLQALIIDLFFTKNPQKRLTFEEKARIMPKSLKRGAYNRILSQGRRNIIKAFFTLYLLGYLEIIDMEEIEGHITLGRKIKEYLETYRESMSRGFSGDEAKRLQLVYRELLDRVKYLIKPVSLKAGP